MEARASRALPVCWPATPPLKQSVGGPFAPSTRSHAPRPAKGASRSVRERGQRVARDNHATPEPADSVQLRLEDGNGTDPPSRRAHDRSLGAQPALGMPSRVGRSNPESGDARSAERCEQCAARSELRLGRRRASGDIPEHWPTRLVSRSVADCGIGPELADFLRTAAGGGDLGGPLQRLLDRGDVDDRDSGDVRLLL
jgi:hypothetical protein